MAKQTCRRKQGAWLPSASLLQLVLFFAYIFASAQVTSAMIYDLSDVKVAAQGFYVQKQTMYSSADTPVGSNMPFIDVNLVLSRSNGDGQAAVLFFDYEMRNAFGRNTAPKTYCCTDGVDCDRGDVILRNMSQIVEPFLVRRVAFGRDAREAAVHIRYDNVSYTSTYYVVITNCEASATLTVAPKSQIVFKNPFGYLPGSEVGLWYYYGLQSLAYLLVSLVYGLFMYLHRAQLLRIQYGVLGLLVLGMLQTFCWYLYMLQRDHSGIQSSGTGALVMAILFTVVRGTVTRLVVLTVCMGIGIIKWSLGSLKWSVFGLSGAFFVSSLAYEVVETLKSTSTWEPNSFLTALVVFGCWICDTIFAWWSLVSLIRTMGQLTLRRQNMKLVMYTRLFYVLIGCFVVFAISLIVHFFVLFTHDVEQIWRSNWLWHAFWHFSFFVIVTIVAILWRPTANNTRYGYAEVYYDEEDGADNNVGSPSENEVQLHAMGATSPIGETKTRSVLSESMDRASSSRPSRDSSPPPSEDGTLSFSAIKDTAAAFSLDDDDEHNATQIRKLN